jgi:predicted phage-related endonuclease
MNTLTKSDLEDLTLLLEDLVKRLPKMERKERIDLAARLKPAAKHLKTIDDAVKEEIKERLKGKEGTVLGEIFRAVLKLVPTKRLDQKAFKEAEPDLYDQYSKETDDQRISFEAR